MRTLFEIVESAKGIGIDACTKEELYFALLAENSLGIFSSKVVMDGTSKEIADKKWWRDMQWEEEFRRRKTAGQADPQVWMGKNVPGNAEYDQRRRVGIKILEKAERGELPNQQAARAKEEGNG